MNGLVYFKKMKEQNLQNTTFVEMNKIAVSKMTFISHRCV